MKSKVYLETSIVSYLTARISKNENANYLRKLTIEWWEIEKPKYEIYTSDLVVQEASAGDPEASAKRLKTLESALELETTSEAHKVAQALLEKAIPQKAAADALHVAVAAINGVDFLLTWNCRHIANPHRKYDIMKVCEDFDYRPPIIVSPINFFEDEE